MSGRRQAQQGTSPFNDGDRVLFSLTFNVDTDDFNGFMELVTRELCNCIQQPRWCFGSATVLPCPRARQTWFVIVLESWDRETHYSVRFFIEAENIYLRGYENQVGARFEFKPDSSRDNKPYLVRSTTLHFGCNYNDLESFSGLTLEDKPPLRQAYFGQQSLRGAVIELAQAANASGADNRGRVQNLLRVIVMFCESIRNRRVRKEMVDLWTVPATLSEAAAKQIKKWAKISLALMNHIHGPPGPSSSGLLAPPIWPTDSAENMGVDNADEAKTIIVLVLFKGDPNQRHGTPKWGDAAPDNNQRRGPGGGAGTSRRHDEL